MGMSTFSHFDNDGSTHMVDVGGKPETDRSAPGLRSGSVWIGTRWR